MDNNRLGQEHNTPRSTRSHKAGKNWKWVKDREEELRTIAPVFQKLEGQKFQDPDPQEWKSFSQRLAASLQGYKAPLIRTVHDRLTATDVHLLRWFWIVLALLILAAITAAVLFSLSTTNISFDTALNLIPDSEQICLATSCFQPTNIKN